MSLIYRAWKYQAEILITNPSSSAGQQAYINLKWLPGMRSDFRDIRFSDIRGVALPYYIESYTGFSTAKIWIKLPASVTKIYLYYGNGGVSSGSNGDNTFEFFDNFSSATLNTAKWNTYGSSVTIVNGEAKIGGSSSGGKELRSKTTFGQSYRVILRAKMTQENGYNVCGFIDVRQSSGFFGGVCYGTYSNSPTTYLCYYQEEERTGVSSFSNAYHVFDISRKGSGNSRLVVDGSTVVSNQTSTRTDSISVGVRSYDAGKYDYLDYIFVVKYIATEPTLTLGRHFLRTKEAKTWVDSIQFSTSLSLSAEQSNKSYLPVSSQGIKLSPIVFFRYPQTVIFDPPGRYKAWKYKGEISISNPSTSIPKSIHD